MFTIRWTRNIINKNDNAKYRMLLLLRVQVTFPRYLITYVRTAFTDRRVLRSNDESLNKL